MITRTDLDEFQQAVGAWQARTFPDSTPATVLAHLRSEVNEELDEAGIDPMEIADCFMLLLALATKGGFSLATVATEKFAINKQRQWTITDPRGFTRHTPDELEAIHERRAVALDEAAYNLTVLTALDDIPALLAEVERLTTERDAARQQLAAATAEVARYRAALDGIRALFEPKMYHDEFDMYIFNLIDTALAATPEKES